MRASFLLVLIQFCLLSSACSVFSGGEKDFHGGVSSTDYLNADEIGVLDVPAPLVNPRYIDLYPVPGGAEKGKVSAPDRKFKLQAPTPLEIIWDNQKVQLRSRGGRQWITVNASAGHVWHLLQKYLNAEGIAVATEDTRAGLIESRWMSGLSQNVLFSDTTSNSQLQRRLRLRVERAADLEISNLYVSVIERNTSSQKAGTSLDWSTTKNMSSSVERVLLNLQGFFVKQDYKKTGVSLVDQSISVEPLIKTLWRDGLMVLQVRQDFNHSWKRVSDGLGDGSFPVVDLNRSLAVYYLKLSGPDAKIGSFYKHLLKKNDLDEFELVSGTVHLHVATRGEVSDISLTDSDGSLLPRELQEALLSLLKDAMQ